MMKLLARIFGPAPRNLKSSMENWFQIEYGKNWEHAYNHYVMTGSIHYKG